MQNTGIKPYNLLHITSKDNATSILKNGFNSSKHNPKEKRNQWLGDGVYFWDGNDDEIEHFAKEVLSNKFNKNNMISLYGTIEFSMNKHFNLDNPRNMELFKSFIESLKGEDAKEFLNLLEISRSQENVDNRTMSKIGRFLGECVNLFIRELNKREYEIDVVSCYFYHGLISPTLLGKNGKERRQFCVKNVEYLNNNISNFKEYN